MNQRARRQLEIWARAALWMLGAGLFLTAYALSWLLVI